MTKSQTFKDISAKNTKNEILSAYESLLIHARELYKKNKQQEQEIEKKQAVITQASESPSGTIQEQLATLRKDIAEKLNEISEKINTELNRLESIQKAVKFEEENLNEMYEINKTAHTLDTLILAHKKEEEEFNEKMKRQQTQWEIEKENYEQTLEEEQQRLRKAWEREQEEFEYEIKLKQQKMKDAHHSEKTSLENELQEKKKQFDQEIEKRQSDLVGQEQELKELREKTAAFTTHLETELQACQTRVTDQLSREHRYQLELLKKEREGERLLSQQTIQALQQKIKFQEEQIKLLNEKTNTCSTQVQEIALKAIESASTSKNLFYPHPIKKSEPVEN